MIARKVSVLGALTALLLAVTACSSSSDSGRAAPNVVLITLDTTRVDHLSCYGYDKATTPRLDQLAREGLRFTKATSTSGLTAMAHASIMTGLFPHRHGLRVFFGPTGFQLEEKHPTLATLLGKEGFQTGAFISAFPASEYFGLDQGFADFDNGCSEELLSRTFSKTMKHDGAFLRERQATAQRRADATTDEALSWLAGRDPATPFFLWVHFFDPHEPALIPPQEITDQFGVGPLQASDWPARATQRRKLKIYDSEIFYMDQQVGRVLDALQSSGDYDHTLVAVLADHGQGLDNHDWYRHRILYQEQIHIPLLLKVPGEAGGKDVPWRVRNVDVVPTILDALGLETPAGLDGKSLLPLIDAGESDGRIAYAEALNSLDAHTPGNLPKRHKDLLFCVMDERWKYIHHFEKPQNSELYDLQNDPKELDNVVQQHPDVQQRLLQELEAMQAFEIEYQDPDELDEQAKQALESLGYVGGSSDGK